MRRIFELDSYKRRLKQLLADPAQMTQWIEEKSPELSKRILGYASVVLDRSTLGMGIKVTHYSDEAVELQLPLSWANRGPAGQVQLGRLVTLAEFALQLFWLRHLDPQLVTFEIVGAEASVSEKVVEDVICRFKMDSFEREKLLFSLNSQGATELEQIVPFYSHRNHKLGEICFRVQMSRSLLLPPA